MLIPSWRIALYALALGLGLGLFAGWKVAQNARDAEELANLKLEEKAAEAVQVRLRSIRASYVEEKTKRLALEKRVQRGVQKYAEVHASDTYRHPADWVRNYNESAGYAEVAGLDRRADGNVGSVESLGVATRNNALCLQWREQVQECKETLKEIRDGFQISR